MRITGGIHRSRSLVAPKGQETRPTSDRVREALFSMLGSEGVFEEQPGPRVLDLYAGSGALGFEAISRGAREAVFVEQARPAVLAIRDNARALDVTAAISVLAMRVDRALDGQRGPPPLGDTGAGFDLVFLDPPYAAVREADFAEILERAARRLTPTGILVLEHASIDEPTTSALVLDRRRRHGDTTLSLFRPLDPLRQGSTESTAIA